MHIIVRLFGNSRFMFLITILLVSASCNNKIENIRLIDFSSGFNNLQTKRFLSEIANQIEYVSLEAKEESYIGEISQICFSDNKILVYDEKLNNLLLFSRSGEFIAKIGKIGKGPGEYTTRV
jgi:hypothetical protein